MKNLVSINLGNFGSTGRIMAGISKLAQTQGYNTYQAYPLSRYVQPKQPHDIILGKFFWWRLSQAWAFFTGLNGCFAVWSTWKFLKKLDQIKPDILHLHNLHNSYINLPMLFGYIKKHRIKVVWTLHDCWPFTGHCPYFTLAQCPRWKTGCGKCPQLGIYPRTLPDLTRLMWNKKRAWFCGVEDMTLVTPSAWLAGLVKQSFLKEYPVQVINNGIDLESFKPVSSDFRAKHHIADADRLLLGVSMGWGKRKGLDVFIELAKKLPSHYKIALVGTDEYTDKQLPPTIISIHQTHHLQELAEIYTAADVFVNPTREENFPTVNIESLACGTPVVTFNTGGSPEILDSTSGCVVPCEDIEGLLREIERVVSTSAYPVENCCKRAENFDRNARFQEYIDLYGQL